MRYRHLAMALGALVLMQMSSSAQATKTRDSAGVRITENPARLTFAVNLKVGDKPIFDVGGLLVASIRSADPIATISGAEAEQRMARTIPTNVSAAERTARMDRMKAMPHASTWPAIGRIYVDPDGNLWVADYMRTWPGPTGYSKFDANGRLIGRLVLPVAPPPAGRLQVIGFGRNDILVRRADEDGAAHLTVYPIISAR